MSSKPKYRFEHLQMDPYVSLNVVSPQCALPHGPRINRKGVGSHMYCAHCCQHHKTHTLLPVCYACPVCLQYEMRNKMFPHRKYVRRDGDSS